MIGFGLGQIVLSYQDLVLLTSGSIFGYVFHGLGLWVRIPVCKPFVVLFSRCNFWNFGILPDQKDSLASSFGRGGLEGSNSQED